MLNFAFLIDKAVLLRHICMQNLQLLKTTKKQTELYQVRIAALAKIFSVYFIVAVQMRYTLLVCMSLHIFGKKIFFIWVFRVSQ